MIQLVYGDLLKANDVKIIAHQTNCRGVAKAGLAKKIMEKYPENHAMYAMLCKRVKPEALLGTVYCVECSDGKIVANLFGQDEFGRQKQYTDYEALDSAMKKLREFMDEKGIDSIGFPHGIGCGLGGGDWNVVKLIIDKYFNDVDCKVYRVLAF